MSPAGPVLCLVLQDLDSESCGTEVNYIISFAVFAGFNPETRLSFQSEREVFTHLRPKFLDSSVCESNVDCPFCDARHIRDRLLMLWPRTTSTGPFSFSYPPRQRWVIDVVAYNESSGLPFPFHTHLVRGGWLMLWPTIESVRPGLRRQSVIVYKKE